MCICLIIRRYTDPVRGIVVHLSVQQHDKSLQFMLDITDFAPGGLPPTSFKFLSDNIGAMKCTDSRSETVFQANVVISKGRSSRTGLPHIVELYQQLTGLGGDDFNLTVATRDDGTTIRVRFAMDLMAPVSADLPYGTEKESHGIGLDIIGMC